MAQSGPSQPGWREQCRQAMYAATLKEARERYGVDAPHFNYRWEHVLAVHRLALRLAQLTGADADVVEAAAWLHDVRKGAGERHPQEGAAFARQFLPQTDFPAHKIEAVACAIAEHMGLWRDEPLPTLESRVLWDADKLAKLGLTAAFHWLGDMMARDRPASLEALLAGLRDAEWQKKTVASMHTPYARRAAQSRLKRFRELWRMLEAELQGDDLAALDVSGQQ